MVSGRFRLWSELQQPGGGCEEPGTCGCSIVCVCRTACALRKEKMGLFCFFCFQIYSVYSLLWPKQSWGGRRDVSTSMQRRDGGKPRVHVEKGLWENQGLREVFAVNCSQTDWFPWKYPIFLDECTGKSAEDVGFAAWEFMVHHGQQFPQEHKELMSPGHWPPPPVNSRLCPPPRDINTLFSSCINNTCVFHVVCVQTQGFSP